MRTSTPPSASNPGPRYLLWISIGLLAAASLPFLVGLLRKPSGGRYLGFEYNLDDHMVYAAWMRQAMAGHFLFDNRFTYVVQPGLTFHLYFLILGWIAAVVGIPLAASLGRIVFSGFFLVLICKLFQRLGFDRSQQVVSLILVTLGGGIGFLSWQMFGTTYTKPSTLPISGILLNQLPVDVWQPEAFVFPSMLTNGLFMVSLTLTMIAYLALLESKLGWKAAVGGFLAVGVLMNIHSYDVLSLALVMAGVLVAQVVRKDVQGAWLARALVIAAGAVIPALWFVHVLQNDPVFQSRAATETFSPNFRSVFAGYLPLLVVGFIGMVKRIKVSETEALQRRRLLGVCLFGLTNVILLIAAAGHTQGYFLSAPLWCLVFFATLVSVGLNADENPAWNLVLSWAMIGLIAIYFPGLFQRKLTMGLSIPWAILASYGLAQGLTKLEPSPRRLVGALAILVLCATSILWVIRDLSFLTQNVANTTRHPIFLDPDLNSIVSYLDKLPGKKVVAALPGSGTPNLDQEGHQVPDSFASPILPDVSPILSGFTGAYTTAGHWSETPDYLTQTGKNYRFLLASPVQGISHVMDEAQRSEFKKETGANYALIPTEAPALPLMAPVQLGESVLKTPTWTLIRLK